MMAPKTTPPTFDFSKLTPTEVAPPVRQAAVSAVDNPALPWVRSSWAAKKAVANSAGQSSYLGKGQQVIVPSANAGQTETLIRKAAEALSRELNERIGVAVRQEENPKVDGKVQRGLVAVQFAAKTAKAPYKRKAKSTDTTTAISTN